MIKKLVVSLGILISIGLIIVLINPDFKYVGLFHRLSNFPNLKAQLTNVSFPSPPSIPVPDLSGFRQIARGINYILMALFSVAEHTLAMVTIIPKLLSSLFDIIKYVFGF